MESILSIIMLVLSFLNVGAPEVYTVTSIQNTHTVIVSDIEGNEYTYYQEIVTVDEGDEVVDCEGQLLKCSNNTVNIEKGSYVIEPLENETRIYAYDLIIHIPYSLGIV